MITKKRDLSHETTAILVRKARKIKQLAIKRNKKEPVIAKFR